MSPTNEIVTSQQLTAEVVSIGDEMTSGARLDTNAQWLSRRLQELGVEVTFHSTVGDTLSHNVDVFRTAAQRADIVVSTGGLGPTRDDLTREALAGVVQQPLELRESSLNHIKSLFSRRQREMPDRNHLQAMFPVGSLEIFNPQGTAPGVDVAVAREKRSDSRIFSLPGVPAEMKRMFDDTVAPRIMEFGGDGNTIAHLVMKFFGAGESDMERRLGEMIARNRQPRVGITVSSATISLRITAIGDSDAMCQQMIAETRVEILDRVGDLYVGDGEQYEQYHAIESTLRQRGESLVVVELGFAAPLAQWFAGLGETPAHRGSISVASVADLCRITEQATETEALLGIKRQFAADWLVMVDRYPCLSKLGDDVKSVDSRYVVVDPRGKRSTDEQSLGGHPAILQQRIGKAAMQLLRASLQSASR